MNNLVKVSLSVLSLAALSLNSCSYDDADINRRVDDLEARLTKLEQTVADINSSVSSLMTTISALENQDQVVSVVTLDDGSGFEVTFSKSGKIFIQNGKDGEDGEDGVDGTTPLVNAKMDSDNIYYWTVNGEWLLDASGAKIPVTSHITPKIRVNGDNFEISYDNEASWEIIGAAGSLPQGAVVFTDVIDGTDSVTFVRSEEDGGNIVIPKIQTFALNIESSSHAVTAGDTYPISYTITAADDGTVIDAIATGGIEISEIQYDIAGKVESGKILVKIPNPIPDNARVFVFAVNGAGTSSMKILSFEKGVFEAMEIENGYVSGDTMSVSATGGEIMIFVSTNYNYTIDIPSEDQSWVSSFVTRSVREEFVTLTIAENTEEARSTTVSFINGTTTYAYFKISQEGVSVVDEGYKGPIEDWVDDGIVDL